MAKKKKNDNDDVNSNEAVAKNDAYTGMLAVSLLLLVGGCVLLFLDISRYGVGAAVPRVTPMQQTEFEAVPKAKVPNPGGGNPGNPPPVNNPPAKKGGNP